MYTAIIIDDELDACNYLQQKIKAITKEISIIAFGHNTQDAVLLIDKHKPDIVFLDIEMRGQNSLDVIKKINSPKTKIILATAFQQYALQALKLHVFDYILKPIDYDELSECIYRFFIEQDKKEISWQELPGEKYFRFKDLNTDYYIHIKDIILFEGNNGYTDISFIDEGGFKKIKSSYSISHYEELLPNKVFVRVHKSYIVNKHHIIRVKINGNKILELTGDISVVVSKRREKATFESL